MEPFLSVYACGVAHFGKRVKGKLLRGALDLLKTQDVRLMVPNPAQHTLEPGSDPVHVESGDLPVHLHLPRHRSVNLLAQQHECATKNTKVTVLTQASTRDRFVCVLNQNTPKEASDFLAQGFREAETKTRQR